MDLLAKLNDGFLKKLRSNLYLFEKVCTKFDFVDHVKAKLFSSFYLLNFSDLVGKQNGTENVIAGIACAKNGGEKRQRHWMEPYPFYSITEMFY